MKTLLPALALSLAAASALSQLNQTSTPASTPYEVVSRGPDQNTWQRTVYEMGPDGQAIPHLHSYQEIGTGLNYSSNGVWTPSSDQITVTATAAAATNGQHQVVFLGNLNSEGAVRLTTPDGKQLSSTILGLGYYDTASGDSVVFAETTNAAGAVLPSGNEAIYTNGFIGIQADVIYSYSISGFEQFVVLRQQPPSPANYGFNPATTFLEALTEFFDPPSPGITPQQTAAGLDELLDFGVVKMARGSAFALGSETNKIPVTKQWLQSSGRTILVEQVPFQSVEPQLQNLPPASSGSASLEGPPDSVLHRVASHRLLPPPRLVRKNTPSLRLADAPPKAKGFVLDYDALITQTNLTLQADTTYYVSGLVNIYGTLTCEGGTVVKYTNSPVASLATTNLSWATTAFRPAIFTAKDDNTVGQTINASSGSPSGPYGGVALNFSANYASTGLVSNARFSYLSNAIACPYSTFIQDVQFNFCLTVVNALDSNYYLRNVLLNQCGRFQNGCTSCGINIEAENSTFDGCTNLVAVPEFSTLYLTNCIFVALE